MNSLALVIPSFQRPNDLVHSVTCALGQSRPFDEIVVVLRDIDGASADAIRELPVTVVMVSESGVLAAMGHGVRATTSDVVAFTDDDARVPANWSTELLKILDDPLNATVGAVGGRDVLYSDDRPRSTRLKQKVGRVTWGGRVIGNHHCGVGPARNVDVLKGVNSAYRRTALRLPVGLRGDGAQAHYEVAVGQCLIAHGWTMIYDPSITVQHHPAARVGDDQREAPSDQAVYDSAFNVMRALAPTHQWRRWLYVHVVGDSACPGLVRLGIAVTRRDRRTLARRAASWRATHDAFQLRKTELEFHSFN